MSPILGIFITLSMLLQTINSQRPIVNASTSATSSSSSLFNAYEPLSPSIAPAAPPPQKIPQTRSDIAKLRYKPAPNNGTRMAYNDRSGKFGELKESIKNLTIATPNGLPTFSHDSYYHSRRGSPLDKLKKMVQKSTESSYNSHIHNKTNPSQGNDTMPYSAFYSKNDPIKKVKNTFQQRVNML